MKLQTVLAMKRFRNTGYYGIYLLQSSTRDSGIESILLGYNTYSHMIYSMKLNSNLERLPSPLHSMSPRGRANRSLPTSIIVQNPKIILEYEVMYHHILYATSLVITNKRIYIVQRLRGGQRRPNVTNNTVLISTIDDKISFGNAITRLTKGFTSLNSSLEADINEYEREEPREFMDDSVFNPTSGRTYIRSRV